MSVANTITEFKTESKKSLEHLISEFAKLQTGRASSVLVEDLQVEVYGATQPIKALAQISIPEARTISIKPWDKGSLKGIEEAVKHSGMSLNPINNGESILINLPQLTEENRRELVKLVHKFAEEARVTVRQSRQKAHKNFKSLESSDEITEDEAKSADKQLQSAVDNMNKEIDAASKKKEEEVMKV